MAIKFSSEQLSIVFRFLFPPLQTIR